MSLPDQRRGATTSGREKDVPVQLAYEGFGLAPPNGPITSTPGAYGSMTAVFGERRDAGEVHGADRIDGAVVEVLRVERPRRLVARRRR